MSDYSHQQLVVTPHRPAQRRIEITLWLSLSVFLFLLGLMLGYRLFDDAMVEKRQQQRELERLQLQIGQMEQKLANAELASKIDRVALEQVRQVVTSLQTELAVDKEELGLYRNLLQSGGVKTGLQIGELMLRYTPDVPGAIAYRLVVQQKETKLKRIKVKLSMTLNGLQDGKPLSLSLDSVDEQFETSPVDAQFKYFHILEGVMTLPSGFVPQELVVAAWKKGVSSSRVERAFDWRLDEN
jgi:multidrug efflux pump subunit AcrA (membrane-fusion protein)